MSAGLPEWDGLRVESSAGAGVRDGEVPSETDGTINGQVGIAEKLEIS